MIGTMPGAFATANAITVLLAAPLLKTCTEAGPLIPGDLEIHLSGIDEIHRGRLAVHLNRGAAELRGQTVAQPRKIGAAPDPAHGGEVGALHLGPRTGHQPAGDICSSVRHRSGGERGRRGTRCDRECPRRKRAASRRGPPLATPQIEHVAGERQVAGALAQRHERRIEPFVIGTTTRRIDCAPRARDLLRRRPLRLVGKVVAGRPEPGCALSGAATGPQRRIARRYAEKRQQILLRVIHVADRTAVLVLRGCFAVLERTGGQDTALRAPNSRRGERLPVPFLERQRRRPAGELSARHARVSGIGVDISWWTWRYIVDEARNLLLAVLGGQRRCCRHQRCQRHRRSHDRVTSIAGRWRTGAIVPYADILPNRARRRIGGLGCVEAGKRSEVEGGSAAIGGPALAVIE